MYIIDMFNLDEVMLMFVKFKVKKQLLILCLFCFISSRPM